MFVFTGVSHFHPAHDGFDKWCRSFRVPGFLVTVTGVLELAGAAGLLLPWSAAVAAYGLVAPRGDVPAKEGATLDAASWWGTRERRVRLWKADGPSLKV
jgi:hypothetical protein